MTQQNITVQPNLVTPVSVALAGGATLYNADSQNALWINNSPGVAPNAGMRIGPKGSLTWTANGQPCYACVDTGVTVGIQLSVSTDVSGLVNPVDVGIAVATALALQGVPSVFVGETVYSDTVSGSAGGFIVPADVSRYANLTISLAALNGTIQLWQIDYWDSADGAIVIYSKEYTQAVPDATGITFDTTVRGDTLAISWTDTTPGDIRVRVYGSNRTTPERLIATPQFFTSAIPSYAYAALEEKTFPSTFYTAGGTHHVRVSPNAVNAKGYLSISLVNADGTLGRMTVLDTSQALAGPGGETQLTYQMVLPAGKYNFTWQNGTAMTYAVSINVTPPH